MKNFFLASLLFSLPVFATDFVSVHTVDGKSVNVAPAEILRAAKDPAVFQTVNTANSFETNGDGTVTVNEPRFHFNGQDYAIFRGDPNPEFGGDILSDSAVGACKAFGFRALATFGAEYEDGNGPAAFLDYNGGIKELRKGEHLSVVKSVTCSR